MIRTTYTMRVRSRSLFFLVCVISFSAFCHRAIAQVTDYDEDRRGSIYIGFGYGIASYTSSTIHIKQNSLGNSYDISKVSAKDKAIGKSSSFPFTTSFRIGFYCNYNQTFGIELNYDPAKYAANDGQTVNIKGTIGGNPYNSNIVFSKAGGFQYGFNGTGLILVNAVRRFPIYRSLEHRWAFDGNPKLGIGPVLANSQSQFFSGTVKTGSQICGWNAGLELGIKVTYIMHIYCELSYKYDMVNITGLTVTSSGTATQKFNAKEFLATIGFTFPTTKHNPLFAKGQKMKRVPRGPQPMYKEEKKGVY